MHISKPLTKAPLCCSAMEAAQASRKRPREAPAQPDAAGLSAAASEDLPPAAKLAKETPGSNLLLLPQAQQAAQQAKPEPAADAALPARTPAAGPMGEVAAQHPSMPSSEAGKPPDQPSSLDCASSALPKPPEVQHPSPLKFHTSSLAAAPQPVGELARAAAGPATAASADGAASRADAAPAQRLDAETGPEAHHRAEDVRKAGPEAVAAPKMDNEEAAGAAREAAGEAGAGGLEAVAEAGPAGEEAAGPARPGSQAQTCPICLNAITGKFWVRAACLLICSLGPTGT